MDPFDTLGLPARFDLDAAAVQRAWLAASARLHPDRFAGAQPGVPVGVADTGGPDDPQRLVAISAVNQAKAVLSDPAARAEVLLARMGGPGKSDDKSLPEGFLLDMLEVRERLEEAAATKNPDAIASLEAWAHERRAEHQERVSALFRRAGGADAPDAEAMREIRLELNAWRYIDRMLEQLPA